MGFLACSKCSINAHHFYDNENKIPLKVATKVSTIQINVAIKAQCIFLKKKNTTFLGDTKED